MSSLVLWRDVVASLKETTLDYTCSRFWLCRLTFSFYIRHMLQLGLGPVYISFLGACCCNKAFLSLGYMEYAMRFLACLAICCIIPELLAFPCRVAYRIWLKRCVRSCFQNFSKSVEAA